MTSDKYILDAAGNPQKADLETWAKWFETTDRHLAEDKIGDVRVSTVFLGLDHSFFGGKPLLFETMIFGGNNDQYQARYPTKEEALAGHGFALEAVKSGQEIEEGEVNE